MVPKAKQQARKLIAEVAKLMFPAVCTNLLLLFAHT